jgi:hypothetical protein
VGKDKRKARLLAGLAFGEGISGQEEVRIQP